MRKGHFSIKKIGEIYGFILIVLIIIGFFYERIAEYIDAQTIIPPGQFYQVNGHRLHIYCTGENQNGSPTVILEAGAGNFYSSWKKVQPEISSRTKVCSYDRSGLGFSASSNRKNAQDAANELEDLLTAANINPPYIIVAHSWGGYVARIFVENNLAAVKGIVLVDSSHENQEKTSVSFPNKLIGWAMAGAVKFAANTGIIRLAFTIRPNLMNVAESPPYDNKISRSLWSTPKQQTTALKEAMDSTSWPEVEKARNFGTIPIRVLSSRESIDNLPEWLGWQKDLASLSSNGEQIIVENSSHYIATDQPQSVVQAAFSIIH